MIRFPQGGGPICWTTSAILVWSAFGPLALAAVGGVGPVASWLMTMVAAVGSDGVTEGAYSASRFALHRYVKSSDANDADDWRAVTDGETGGAAGGGSFTFIFLACRG